MLKLAASTTTRKKRETRLKGDKRSACTNPVVNKEAQQLQQDSSLMLPRFSTQMSESCCAGGRVALTAPQQAASAHKEIRIYAKCVLGEEMKRGDRDQHSKIGPVNNDEYVAGNADARHGVGEETKRARLRGAVEQRVRESGKRAAALAHHKLREIEPQIGSC